MNIDHEKLTRFRHERWIAIDVDGTAAGMIGNSSGAWQKRAIAEQRISGSGYGLYDAAAEAVVVEPDHEKRTKWLLTEIASASEKLETAQAKLRLIS